MHDAAACLLLHAPLRLVALEDGELAQHLLGLDAALEHVTLRWLRSAFAGFLRSSCVERIWDCVLCSTPVLLVFVAAAVVRAMRLSLLAAKSSKEARAVLAVLPDLSGDHLTNAALEQWRKVGKPLDAVQLAGALDHVSPAQDPAPSDVTALRAAAAAAAGTTTAA